MLFFCWHRKTNPYGAQMRSKGSLRRHFYRPRAGARRANHHPCPLLKGGELWGQSANTLQSAASFLGKHISHSVRLAVPEKIFALLAYSIFSTAADAPPRCICHRQRSAPHPTHRDPLASKAPTISQTRKLFVKVCANWALSLQIPLVSSGLVKGASLTGKHLPHSDLYHRSLSSFVFLFSPACAPVRTGDLNSAKRR